MPPEKTKTPPPTPGSSDKPATTPAGKPAPPASSAPAAKPPAKAPAGPTYNDISDDPIVARLKARFGAAIEEAVEFLGRRTLRVAAEQRARGATLPAP